MIIKCSICDQELEVTSNYSEPCGYGEHEDAIDVKPCKNCFTNATHKISAVYYPKILELELTWEDIETGEHAGLMVNDVAKEVGMEIQSVVMACVYQKAIHK